MIFHNFIWLETLTDSEYSRYGVDGLIVDEEPRGSKDEPCLDSELHEKCLGLVERVLLIGQQFNLNFEIALCLVRISNMKFLEYTPLDSINFFLSNVNLGECTLKGNLEAYSCKHTGTDRKLSLSLEQEILDYLGQSLDSNTPSPPEFLSSRSSRKTVIYLVLTLSHMYPDYDFSAVKAHHFFREEGWESFKQIFDTYMFEAAKEWAVVNGDSSLLESMSKAIDEVVRLEECEIYSYNPDFEGDPLLERGAIWSFNFFFYNRKLKRVVSFHCCCLRLDQGWQKEIDPSTAGATRVSNLAMEGFDSDEVPDEDDDEEIFDGMDM